MQSFDNITDARNAIMDFRADHFSDVPEPLRAKFKNLAGSPSPVDQIVNVGEFLYAKRAELSGPAKDLAGGLIAYATLNSWYGLNIDNRGNRIAQAMRRDLGEEAPPGSTFPDAADDPAPLPQFNPPAPPASPPAPAA